LAFETLSDARPAPHNEVLEGRVAAVAAGDPDNLGWWSTALQDLDKVVVFGDDHGFHLTSLLENIPVLGTEEAKILNVYRPAFTKVMQPPGKSRGKLGIDPDWRGRVESRHLRREGRVIEAPYRISQASGDIVRLQIGIGREDLLLALSRGQEIEDVGHPDPHPPDTGAPPALVRVDRDPVEQVCHGVVSSRGKVPEHQGSGNGRQVANAHGVC
jgi:hypothetical protein